MSNRSGLAVIISAPSGGGKTTIVDELIRRHPDWMRSISMTTRAPRPGEQNGRDYFFTDSMQFEIMKKQQGFLESAQVHQNQYGTPRAHIEEKVKSGNVIFLTVDVQGMKQIKQLWPDLGSLLSVFIMPVSIDVLRERLLKRNTERPDQIEVRLAAAKREIEQAPLYDFTVYNHNLDQTADEIERVILDKVQKRRSE